MAVEDTVEVEVVEDTVEAVVEEDSETVRPDPTASQWETDVVSRGAVYRIFMELSYFIDL